MRSLTRTVVFSALSFVLAVASSASAQETPPAPPQAPPPAKRAPGTNARTQQPLPQATLPAPALSPDDAGVGRARELLARARMLDESATNDEKLASDLTKAIPALRSAAKAARERVSRPEAQNRPDHEALVARAEELEAELAIDEVDVAVKKHAAAENRRLARELRALAVRVVKEPAALAEADAQNPCDPPYRYTADGRKIYRVECF